MRKRKHKVNLTSEERQTRQTLVRKRFFILGFVLTFCVCFTTAPFAQFSAPQSSGQLSLPIGAKAHLGKGGVSRMRYSADNKHLAVATGAGIVWIYETENYQPVTVLEGHPGQVGRIEFSSDSKQMLSGVHTEGLAYEPLIPSMPPLPPFLAEDDTKQFMAIPTPSFHSPTFVDEDETLWCRVPNSDMIAAWQRNTVSIRFFNVNTGEYLYEIICCLINYPGRDRDTLYIFNGPAFSPDGRHVAIPSDDGTVRIFDIHNRNTHFTGDVAVIESDNLRARVSIPGLFGRSVAVIDGHTRHMTSIAFSPDGSTLATDSVMATLWDVDTQTLLRRFTGSPGGQG